LAEVFSDAGYDAIVYKSQFGKQGFNVVLFNPNDADVINCAPYRVSGFKVSFSEIGKRWFRVKKRRGSATMKRKRRPSGKR
jgi:hypothetical protein